MTSTDTLLPCPFCGGRARVYKAFPQFDYPWHTAANHDDDCMMQSVDTLCHATEAEAIAAWNRRTPPTPATEEREAVARAICGSHADEIVQTADGSMTDNEEWNAAIDAAAKVANTSEDTHEQCRKRVIYAIRALRGAGTPATVQSVRERMLSEDDKSTEHGLHAAITAALDAAWNRRTPATEALGAVDERDAVARAISKKTFAYCIGGSGDCGDWEEMDPRATAIYLKAAAAALSALAPYRAAEIAAAEARERERVVAWLRAYGTTWAHAFANSIKGTPDE